MKVSGLRTNARRGGSEARPSTPATGGRFSAGRAPHIAPPRGRRVGTTGTGANLRARRRRPAASTCAPLQKGACAAGTAGASGSGRRPKARSLQLYNTRDNSAKRSFSLHTHRHAQCEGHQRLVSAWLVENLPVRASSSHERGCARGAGSLGVKYTRWGVQIHQNTGVFDLGTDTQKYTTAVDLFCGPQIHKIHSEFSPTPNTQNTDLTPRGGAQRPQDERSNHGHWKAICCFHCSCEWSHCTLQAMKGWAA